VALSWRSPCLVLLSSVGSRGVSPRRNPGQGWTWAPPPALLIQLAHRLVNEPLGVCPVVVLQPALSASRRSPTSRSPRRSPAPPPRSPSFPSSISFQRPGEAFQHLGCSATVSRAWTRMAALVQAPFRSPWPFSLYSSSNSSSLASTQFGRRTRLASSAKHGEWAAALSSGHPGDLMLGDVGSNRRPDGRAALPRTPLLVGGPRHDLCLLARHEPRVRLPVLPSKVHDALSAATRQLQRTLGASFEMCLTRTRVNKTSRAAVVPIRGFIERGLRIELVYDPASWRRAIAEIDQ
jgi:hypothetical protein